MKCLVILTAFVLIGARCDETEPLDAFVQKLENYVEKKCISNADEDDFEHLKKTTLAKLSNLKDKISEPETNEDLFDLICKDIYTLAYSGLRKATKALDPCLQSEEKYFPDFLLTTFNASLDFYCSKSAQQLVAEIGNLGPVPCFLPVDAIRHQIVNVCSAKLKVLEIKSDGIITETALCSDLESMNTCILEIVKRGCLNDATLKFVSDNVRPLVAWCKRKSVGNVVD